MAFVSVIVPVRNGEETIRQCLLSLLRMDFPREYREILVIDNGSTDDTPEIVKQYPVRYLKETRRGASVARNAGIRRSRGEILAFTDADCVVSTGWLREIVRGFEQTGIDGVAGEVFAYPPRTRAEQYAARVRHLSPRKYLSRPLLPFAVFANLAFRREVFDRIGLLDETFVHGESTDFCTRFFKATEFSLHVAPKAVVFHKHRHTTWGFVKQQWGYGRAYALLYIKYRHEIPWRWRWSQAGQAYKALGEAAFTLVKAALSRGLARPGEDVYFLYYEFLKKLAERLGFIRQSLAKGYFYI